ncbi:putative Ankyrin repeat domain-containing protein 10 [Glarea lozoyensis 74030]|uniref:Putative Ankyrin repeat domain-containing protein 10 n=1 Tax=Glarea lozoyensis (strain ATCC 74030 / MF5533) TaxID=1104152 RepID=H0ES32_GLAL7|nr:putative Ankyrin repeat domain-containing protein 10 [Glarea lozoyensis 74030]
MAHLQETEAPGPKKMKLSQDHPEYEVVDSEYRQEDNWTPLHEAADRVDIPKLKYLLNLGKFDVNAVTKETNMTALHFAVQAWHTPDNRGRQPEAVKLLLENGAAVDPHDYVGKTPLHMSVQTDSLDVTRMLIERGANVNVGSQIASRDIVLLRAEV